MNARERLLTALQKGIPDRVPVVFRMQKFLRKYYPDIYITSQREYQSHQDFGVDIWADIFVVPTPCLYPYAAPWRDDIDIEVVEYTKGAYTYWNRRIITPKGELNDVKYIHQNPDGTGSTTPEIVEPLVKDFDRDIPLLEYMCPDTTAWSDLFQSAFELDEKLANRGLGISHLYSLVDHRDVIHQQDFLTLSYDNPKAFQAILEVFGNSMLIETKAALDAGLKNYQAWWYYTSPSYGWSPTIYAKYFFPYLQKQVELVHSYPETLFVLYDDGKMLRFMDYYVDSGVDAVMTLTPPPMGDADPVLIKNRYGKQVCLMGGIDVVNEVCFSEPEKIRKTVKERMAAYKDNGAYICDGGGSIPYETPVENVQALVDAALEYGSY